mmetsp:Transcript_60619/g.180537  ORF Transcript_60619/g.180537 Transcript_60619/m.180537 type:complete len:216 (-) Transcript_60619:1188-1835(-)
MRRGDVPARHAAAAALRCSASVAAAPSASPPRAERGPASLALRAERAPEGEGQRPDPPPPELPGQLPGSDAHGGGRCRCVRGGWPPATERPAAFEPGAPLPCSMASIALRTSLILDSSFQAALSVARSCARAASSISRRALTSRDSAARRSTSTRLSNCCIASLLSRLAWICCSKASRNSLCAPLRLPWLAATVLGDGGRAVAAPLGPLTTEASS